MYMCNCGKNENLANEILKKLNDIYPTQRGNVTTKYADIYEMNGDFCFPYPPDNKLVYINDYEDNWIKEEVTKVEENINEFGDKND